jgi:hypothetical protein
VVELEQRVSYLEKVILNCASSISPGYHAFYNRKLQNDKYYCSSLDYFKELSISKEAGAINEQRLSAELATVCLIPFALVYSIHSI